MYDLIVVGSGPGGYIAAIRAAQLGLKVACIDKRKSPGGTCLNVGCIPSKALLQSTEQLEWLQKSSGDQGFKLGEVSLDFGMMMSRKEGIVGGLVDGIHSLFKRYDIAYLQGNASFIDPHTIEIVDGTERQTAVAKFIIIATGSEPIDLPFLRFDEKTVISSTGALCLKEPPKRLVVIGGGAIGVELASVYRRLGSAVMIVEMLETITPTMDPAICKQLLQSLKKQGIDFMLGAKVTGAQINKGTVTLGIEHKQKNTQLEADIALIAIGRRPYTKQLGLEAIGINPTPKGFIPVDGNFKTSLPHIFAIGDVIEGPMLAHRASHEGTAVAELIMGRSATVNYMSIPNVIYTHPEAASVGLTEVEAKEAGLNIVIGTSYFRGNGRARCNGETEGFVKIIGEKTTGRLVGMHIVGPHASELIAEGILALDKKATIHDIANACHPHPTLSEVMMEAAINCL